MYEGRWRQQKMPASRTARRSRPRSMQIAFISPCSAPPLAGCRRLDLGTDSDGKFYPPCIFSSEARHVRSATIRPTKRYLGRL
ncbi:hypothetical protein L226DRAFT_104355 [Lentinus tigrinus ALCF2SS1-7]|uniref:uncharacterized protein n=1 Tax=Lentinus tigrinus ALCF2SS1-7 TaxID=1328758 RepID=UPI0011662F34|nr:hypothetical protein L226DRAFT_104355 [Lentinus tigrinus ALCF2SS1-7]